VFQILESDHQSSRQTGCAGVFAIEWGVGFIKARPLNRLGEVAERVVRIDQVVESGLKELKGGRIILGRFLRLHRKTNLQRVRRKNSDFLKMNLQIVTPCRKLAIPENNEDKGFFQGRLGIVPEEVILTSESWIAALPMRVTICNVFLKTRYFFPIHCKLSISMKPQNSPASAPSHGITLRQSYARKAKQWLQKASGYVAARQFKRLERCDQDLKNWLGRVLRDIEKKRGNKVLSMRFLLLIDLANKLQIQEKNTPNKIYSLHEPEVQCIAKGKTRIRYEFGQKAAVVKTNSRNWVVNVAELADNPYDGHPLDRSILGAEKITKVSGTEANVDRGYRKHDYKGSAVIRIAGLSRAERRRKRRRSSVEPVIGHLKSDHRLGRCFLRVLTHLYVFIIFPQFFLCFFQCRRHYVGM